MAKISPAQRTILSLGSIDGNYYAGEITWQNGHKNATPTVKALISLGLMQRVRIGGSLHRATITDAGHAALSV